MTLLAPSPPEQNHLEPWKTLEYTPTKSKGGTHPRLNLKMSERISNRDAKMRKNSDYDPLDSTTSEEEDDSPEGDNSIITPQSEQLRDNSPSLHQRNDNVLVNNAPVSDADNQDTLLANAPHSQTVSLQLTKLPLTNLKKTKPQSRINPIQLRLSQHGSMRFR